MTDLSTLTDAEFDDAYLVRYGEYTHFRFKLSASTLVDTAMFPTVLEVGGVEITVQDHYASDLERAYVTVNAYAQERTNLGFIPQQRLFFTETDLPSEAAARALAYNAVRVYRNMVEAIRERARRSAVVRAAKLAAIKIDIETPTEFI